MRTLVQRIILLAMLPACTSSAGVIDFDDATAWNNEVDEVVTLDGTEFPAGTTLSDQYADLGVTFIDGDDFIDIVPQFEDDRAFLDGFDGRIGIGLDVPTIAIAVTHIGRVQFDLFLEGTLVGQSSFSDNAGGTPSFFGVVSSVAFDEVHIYDPADNNVFVGDIFIATVPQPTAVILFALAAGRRRRRRA